MSKNKFIEECVLYINGYYQYNCSYYSFGNSYCKVDQNVELKEETEVNALGHKIVIDKVNENSVDITVDDEKSVTLNINDKICIEYYNRTSGSNENFTVDVMELFVSLVKK